MTVLDTRKAIQTLLGVPADGIIGPKSMQALHALVNTPDGAPWPAQGGSHTGLASSFADPADVEAFRKCKAQGHSDEYCFAKGDNGVGCWGDDCSEGSGASCAVPPEDMEERWGSVNAAKHKQIRVSANGKTEIVTLKDRMPHKENITNGAVIDLNPDTAKALGLTPPFMVAANWEWV